MPHLIQIAVVEDDDELQNDLVEFLRLRGFAASGFDDAESLLHECSKRDFDLVILDILLPGMDGLQVAQWLRNNSKAGIIMLTSLKGQADHVRGLTEGADAYLVKHISLDVLEATCRSVLRRIREHPSPQPVQTGWRLSANTRLLTSPDGGEITLTHGEALFLQCLLEQPGQAVSRKAMLDHQGKADTLANLRNLDNYARLLRRKTSKQLGTEIPILASYNSGYTFTGEGGVNE